MLKRIPGTRDILPNEACLWRKAEEECRNIFSLYNYREIRTPLLEEAALFNRTLGEATEIVNKQMFLIKNKEGLYALRPEGTASIVRAYLENNLDKNTGLVKFYYLGPMFRKERPQKGRLRQFHHIGCEAIGSQDPALDIEIISLADRLLKALEIGDYQIKINSLGCPADKKRLSLNLKKLLKNKVPKLCPQCRTRFNKNIFRVLDCKEASCRQIAGSLGISETCLCRGCNEHFAQVKTGLDDLAIAYEIIPYLVRGLDYYSRTVFEITHPQLGAQDALGAGGRYDNLVKELGGADSGAMGFALGMERLLLAHSAQRPARNENLVYLITLGENARKEGIKLLHNLRQHGIACDTDYEGKSLKGAMRKANDSGARFVLLIGEDELKKGAVTLKDMVSGEQRVIPQERLIQELKC
jgi:histidyl-tRNA synthetase